MTDETVRGYAQRAEEYDRIFDVVPSQPDLARLRVMVAMDEFLENFWVVTSHAR